MLFRSGQYIANMRDGAAAGFKYFRMETPVSIRVETSGEGRGTMEVSDTPDFARLCAELKIAPGTARAQPLDIEPGVRPLYFRFRGEGSVNFHAFTLLTG